MVFDHLTHAPEYFNLGQGIRAALEFLQRTDIGSLTPGRHDVDGDRVFALVSDYDTKEPAETFWEAHRRHIDVQYVHSGRERIGHGDLARFDTEPYDAERDLVVARGGEGQFVEVDRGRFVILFPHDVHMPGLTARRQERVRKVVVKVRIG
jgi:biofilm protein TabA